MYVAISTGRNLNYGKKGEKREFSNHHAKVGEKEGWLYNLRYAGSGNLQIKIVGEKQNVKN